MTKIAARPQGTVLRSLTTLLSISVIRVGVYTLLNFPALFEGILIKEFRVSTLEISYLYSMMAFPNIFCNLLGSILINFIGLGLSSIIFTTLPFLSMIMTYWGYLDKNFSYLVIGRFVYGFGFENTLIVQAVAAEKYFSGGNLTAILALNRTMSNLAAAFASFYQPVVFVKARSLDMNLLIYGLIAFVSVGGAIYLAFREVSDERDERRNRLEGKKESRKLRRFRLSDFKKISGLSWIMFVGGALFIQGYMQFSYFANDFFIHRTGLSLLESKSVMSVNPILSMFLIPIFSIMVWKFGKKGIFVLLGTFLLCIGYAYMLFLPEKAELYQCYIAITIVSLYWCVYCSAFWSSFIITLPEQATGVMIGLSLSVQNVFSTTVSPLFGKINEDRDPSSYQKSLKYLFGFSIFLFLFCLLMVYVDLKGGKQIHMCEGDMEVKQNRKKMTRDFEVGGSLEKVKEEKNLSDESTDDSLDLDLDVSLIQSDEMVL